MAKLVAYFSAEGTTRKRAGELAKAAGADLYEIAPETPYSAADLDWRVKTSRASKENDDPAARPALKEAKKDLSSYDTIYIGFPIWWGVAPRVINTFIDNNDFAGKKVVLFATSGGSGIDYAKKALEKTYPDLDIVGAALLRGTVTKDIL